MDMFVDENQIARYLYQRLIEDGYVPGTDEILDLAEYVMDFLMDIADMQGIEVEVTELEEDED